MSQSLNLTVLLLFIIGSLLQGAPNVSLSTTIVNMGDIIKVEIKSKYPLEKYSVGFTNRIFKLMRRPSKKSRYYYYGYVAAARKLPSKKYPLKVYFKYKDTNKKSNKKQNKIIKKGVKKFMVTVNHPPQKTGEVTLTKKKNALSSNQNQLIKESRIISKGFHVFTPIPQFKSSFILPARGKMTSGFGVQRYYNGSYSRSHAGVDIANKINTPVVSPHNGKVILSKKLKVHGNTVMIDHGMGIVTIYNHLNKRTVRRNQIVKKGDHIGKVGQTGVATGPHLHWGMSVQNVRVNPLFWVNKNKLN
jgi:murein DD-endopeptidase MepM/ murein hydrolase activator NlpD